MKASSMVPKLALVGLDEWWDETLRHSVAGRIFAGLLDVFRKPGEVMPALTRVGTGLQTLSFLTVLLLSVVLAAPQFTSDKEGLALMVWFGLLMRVLGYVMSGRENHRFSAVDGLVLAYFGVNVVSVLSSHYLVPSVKGLAKVLTYIASYFLFTGVLQQSRKRAIWIFSAMVLTGLLVSLYGLYQYKVGVAPLATWEDPSVEIQGTRIFSTLGNPNLLAGYLMPLTPIALSLSLVAAGARRGWWALPALGSCLVIALSLVLTGSRGGYLGLFASVAALVLAAASWLWREQPKSRPWIAAGLAALPVLLLAALSRIPTFDQRLKSIFAGGEHTSNRFRLNVWHASWLMFLDSWWLGIGPGRDTFTLAYGLYMVPGFDALGAYSVPLEIAVECGTFGLLVFLGILVVSFARAHLSFWRTTDATERWLSAGCMAALLGMMVHGLVDTVFFRPQVQFIFWLLIAFIAVCCGKRSAEPSRA